MPYKVGDTRTTATDLVAAALGPAFEGVLGVLPAGVRLNDSGAALALRLGLATVAPAEPASRLVPS